MTLTSVRLKNLLLFICVSGLDGVCILVGSFVGHGLHNIFVGATIGGIVGVAVAVWVASRFHLLESSSYVGTLVGGLLGFVAAANIAVKNLHGPIIPIASVFIIGLGALIGKLVSHQRAA
jgi:hypothetical protein